MKFENPAGINPANSEKKLSKTSKVLIGGLIGGMAAGAFSEEAKGAEYKDIDMKDKKSHELVLKNENKEEVSAMMAKALQNPENIENIIIDYAWKIASSKKGDILTAKDAKQAIEDFNKASAFLSSEDQKKLRGNFYEVVGKYSNLPSDRIIGEKEKIGPNSPEAEKSSENLEEIKAFIDKMKKIPDQENASSASQKRLFKQRVAKIELDKFTKGNPQIIEEIKKVLQEEKSGQDDVIDYLKFILNIRNMEAKDNSETK
ncbi:MAG: hypothetical protein V1804_03255 [Patescibacteria group bacterium]